MRSPALFSNATNSKQFAASFSDCRCVKRRERNHAVEPFFLCVLSFVRASHRSVHPTGRDHTLERRLFPWPKSFSEPPGFAASRARRRWITPHSLPPDAL